MLGWDLSDTLVTRDETPRRAPNEGEQHALFVGLMLVDDCSFRELRGQVLTLTHENREDVAQVLER